MATGFQNDAQLGTGSSSPFIRPPNISQSAQAESSAIAASLASRRRRGSIRNLFTGKKGKSRSPDRENPDGLGSEAEEEESEEALRAVVEAGERMKAEMPEAVEVLKGGRKVDVEDEEGGEPRQEFVWDVLFENQRGIYLLGKAYFSSQSLLPMDPSAFTVPSHTLPSASSFTISADGKLDVQRRRTKPAKNTKDPKDRPIKTLYTPDTYQTPSPAWMWVTPWMLNMRTGTDEGGWRYNALFRKKSWGSHAGPAGWGGWVRRREWVRLRCLTPKGEVLEAPGMREDAVIQVDQGLKEVMASYGVNRNMDSVLKAMGRIPLDRQKVDTWKRWLDEGDERSLERLQQVLKDENAVSPAQFTRNTADILTFQVDTLSRSVTHHRTVGTLLGLFKQHHLSVSQPATPTLSSPSPSPAQRDAASTSPKLDTDD